MKSSIKESLNMKGAEMRSKEVKRIDMKKLTAAALSAVLVSSMVFMASGCVPTEVINAINNQGNKNIVKSTDIKAQDDFYGYVNSEYLLSVDVENGYLEFGDFGELQTEAIDLLSQEVIRIGTSNEEYEYGSKEYIIQKAFQEMEAQYDEDYYMEGLNAMLPDVLGNLNKIRNASTPEELLTLCVENQCGLRPWLTVSENPLNASEYAFVSNAHTAVLGVDIEEVKGYINAIGHGKDSYVALAKQIGTSESDAEDEYLALEYIAVEICWATEEDEMTASRYRSADASFVDDKALNEIFTNVNYKDIEKAYGITNNPYGGWIVYSPNQLKAINDAYVMDNLDALKNWAIYEYVQSNSDVLSLEFDKLVPAQMGAKDDEKIAMQMIYNQYLFDELSMLYTELVYDEETDTLLRELIDDIREGYRQKINSSSILTDEAKELLIKKLDNIVVLTAKDVDTSVIDTDKADCFTGKAWETDEKLYEYAVAQQLSNIGKTVPKDKLVMPMNEVNACYTSNNVIVITLAIQQGNFFSVDSSYEHNLGKIGTVIAHEIGHAFDSEGMKYDYNGTYNPEWLPKEDTDALEIKNQAAIEYFETAFRVENIYSVDGSKTLTENFADLGGVEVCVSLLSTDEEYKEFFESYATNYCELVSPTDISSMIENDTHSPGIIRTNAVLATIDEFIEVYDIKEGDGMYIMPEDRISRWN